MHIETRTSLLRAQAILKLVEVELAHHSGDLSISQMGYENARECGVYLLVEGRDGIAWAEHRSSDQIVIYTGPSHEFDGQGRIPSEELYDTEGAKHYIDGEAKAVKFIVEHLLALQARHYPVKV